MTEGICPQLVNATRSEAYTRKLGLCVEEAAPGRAVVSMRVTDEMVNLFGTAHGGAIFSLLDEAFEVSCNSHGTIAVALNCNVSYVAPAFPGDTLRAVSAEVSRSARVATYDIRVTNQDGALVATCNALAYRKKEALPFIEAT